LLNWLNFVCEQDTTWDESSRGRHGSRSAACHWTNVNSYGRRIRGNAIFRGIKIALTLHENGVSPLPQILENGMTSTVR
jgi:hypothetical protein